MDAIIKIVDIVAWPVAVVVGVVVAVVVALRMFRGDIGELIRRCRGAKFGDKSIDFTGEQSQKVVDQQKEAEGAATERGLEAVSGTQGPPPPNSVYAPVEQEIGASIANAHFSADIEKAWLIRWLAITQVERAHERTYRIIFGSQISLLLAANTPSPPDRAGARQFYDNAKAIFPAAYTNIVFDNWLKYPIATGLLTETSLDTGINVFRITALGQDFLHYLVSDGLTAPKYF